MAVFGAPVPYDDHAERAFHAARAMHRRQAAVDAEWEAQGLAPFGLGIGLSTGEVAAALLGSEERLEYTVVGDTVNLSQRLKDAARPAGTTLLSEATVEGLAEPPAELGEVEELQVKGRAAPVRAYRLPPE
jgi:class 3 adenylate cyclase